MNFMHNILISFFYVGYLKYAPGTAASLLAMLIFYFIPNILILQSGIVIFIALCGFILCYNHSRDCLEKDPSFIVIDEVVGMSISLFMIPKNILFYVLCFLIFRYLDIYKPFLIDKSQNVEMGIGIMLDDVLSGLITCLLAWVIISWL